MMRSTPILLVDAIEPSLPFWEERLGYERFVEVPESEGGPLVFVTLRHGPCEVMLQTHKSLDGDLPSLGDLRGRSTTCLFIEVDDLDAVDQALEGVPRTFDRRKTFYGSTELGVRTPGGHLVTFAHFAER